MSEEVAAVAALVEALKTVLLIPGNQFQDIDVELKVSHAAAAAFGGELMSFDETQGRSWVVAELRVGANAVVRLYADTPEVAS